MKLRPTVMQAFILLSIAVNSPAQVRSTGQAMSASHVAAEITKGKLSVSRTKPGDEVAMRLKDDLRSNGRVVLKKGTTITGVVRNVKTVDANDETMGHARSMMEIEWLVPAANGALTQQVSVALQSVTQFSALYGEGDAAYGDIGFPSSPPPSSDSASGLSLGGGVLGMGGLASTASAAVPTATARGAGNPNAALLSMPSVMAADDQTSAALESTLGTSSSAQLFKVGRGELVSANGSKQSLDLFSHLSNDTVITSPSKNFEISAGAQIQFLVGVNKQ
jgi:hypothetical protein